MLKLKATSRLGKKLLASTGSLTSGDPFESPKGLDDEHALDEVEALKLHFRRGDYVVVTDGEHVGTKGVVVWVGNVNGNIRTGVKPLRGELVMVNFDDVRKEEGKIG